MRPARVTCTRSAATNGDRHADPSSHELVQVSFWPLINASRHWRRSRWLPWAIVSHPRRWVSDCNADSQVPMQPSRASPAVGERPSKALERVEPVSAKVEVADSLLWVQELEGSNWQHHSDPLVSRLDPPGRPAEKPCIEASGVMWHVAGRPGVEKRLSGFQEMAMRRHHELPLASVLDFLPRHRHPPATSCGTSGLSSVRLRHLCDTAGLSPLQLCIQSCNGPGNHRPTNIVQRHVHHCRDSRTRGASAGHPLHYVWHRPTVAAVPQAQLGPCAPGHQQVERQRGNGCLKHDVAKNS